MGAAFASVELFGKDKMALIICFVVSDAKVASRLIRTPAVPLSS